MNPLEALNPSNQPVDESKLSLRERNKLRSRKMLEEAMAGTAAASGNATPAQQLTAQGISGGAPPLAPLSPLPGLQFGGAIGSPSSTSNINQELMRTVAERVSGNTPTNTPTNAQGAVASGEVPASQFQNSSSGGGGGIDSFMRAISDLESGGNPEVVNSRTGAHGQFQIMPDNWAPWAHEAGIGANAPKTQENQNLVARHKMNEYYQRFGDWGAVAVAWFAGPDRARRYMEGDTSVLNLDDGNITVREYVDRIQRNMP